MIQWYGANGLAPSGGADPHRSRGRPGRKTAHPGAGARVLAQCLQCLAHGAESLGADVVDRRTGTLGRPAAGIRQVGGVDELVDVVAGPEHRHGRAVGDPVEEDAEDAQPAVTQDRARPHDRHVEPPGDRCPARAARRRAWRVRRAPRAGARSRGSPGSLRGTPKTADDEVCTTLATPARSQAPSSTAVPPTLTDSNRLRSLASGTWATLWNTTSTPATARPTVVGVPDVSPDELHVGGAVGGVDQVEHPHPVAGGKQVLDQERPEVAAAPGDQSRPDAHAVGSWWRGDPVRGPRS